MIVAPKSGRPYANPYVAGVGLGLVLLAAYVVMGRGLGASGAFSAVVAACVDAVAPAHAEGRPAFAAHLGAGSPLRDWLVFEILGVFAGAFLSARWSGRAGRQLDRGAGCSARRRLLHALAGGAVMGVGAKLARGCTSGQALTGGALLSVGSWIFLLAAFAAGFAFAPLFRRQWR